MMAKYKAGDKVLIRATVRSVDQAGSFLCLRAGEGIGMYELWMPARLVAHEGFVDEPWPDEVKPDAVAG